MYNMLQLTIKVVDMKWSSESKDLDHHWGITVLGDLRTKLPWKELASLPKRLNTKQRFSLDYIVNDLTLAQDSLTSGGSHDASTQSLNSHE